MGDSASFVVGIDLGTTHSALSSIELDLSEGDEIAEAMLGVPQLVSPGVVDAKPLLPSFLYLPHGEELTASHLSLPWGARPFIVGELARTMGAQSPIRLVSSAKSWLCHSGIDRREGTLPIEAPPEVERISPVDASMRYLEHLRDAWNHAHPDAPLADQEVTVTVPASFDPAARELTAEAAERAGLKNVTLLEEPQAALYSWIAKSRGGWRKEVRVGDIILVVDIGGGTTDFSLIAVTEQAGTLELRRIAVGDHILLGGDNMDLALAHAVAQKLEAEGKNLDPWQLSALGHVCRGAKERLLSDTSLEEAPIVVPSRGSKLVGGSIRTSLTRAEVEAIVLEGFFPAVERDAALSTRPRAALTRLGLPYAQDAAITRHLAAFLGKQRNATEDLTGFAAQKRGHILHPTAILFNGGVCKAEVITARITERLTSWLAAEEAAPARVLGGNDLDLAVARGAAYYGYVRRGKGVRIRGGTAHAFYVGIESSAPAVPGVTPQIEALCVAPFGIEEGSSAEMAKQELGLVVGEPVRLRFFGSSVRRDDEVGTTLRRWSSEELRELDELEITLPVGERTPGEVVPVRLCASITDVGTLSLEALPRSGNERWKVELDVPRG